MKKFIALLWIIAICLYVVISSIPKETKVNITEQELIYAIEKNNIPNVTIK